jgi:hypothetical protein
MIFKVINSEIMVKIVIAAHLQIISIIIIFAILVYFQSQQTLLGNIINIAGKRSFPYLKSSLSNCRFYI